MSGSIACRCGGFCNTTKRVAKQAYREKNWRVVQRKCNHSAFNGYHHTSSDYSCVTCLVCRGVWRTKAAYVRTLKDVTDKQLGINRGQNEEEET